jgi:hypothetical protein
LSINVIDCNLARPYLQPLVDVKHALVFLLRVPEIEQTTLDPTRAKSLAQSPCQAFLRLQVVAAKGVYDRTILFAGRGRRNGVDSVAMEVSLESVQQETQLSMGHGDCAALLL